MTPLAVVVNHLLANLSNLSKEELQSIDAMVGAELQDRDTTFLEDIQEKVRFDQTITNWS